MNITELDQYSLKDAVKFHHRLNPRLWGRDEHLLPEVREKLLAVAADFQEFLGVPDLDVEDITISGSNAAYSYTDGSDIDLHLIVRMPDAASEVYQELFNAKKYQYNDEHDIRIGGADVELYVQPSDQPHHSQGIYSIRDGAWRQVPRRRRVDIDDHCVLHKTEDLAARIDAAIQSRDETVMQRLWDKIKTMRKTGLAGAGEFGCDNLAFKLLRRSGHLERLQKAKTQAHDQALSLQERKKRRKKTRYGFGGWWYPGFAYGSESGEGGGDGGGESMREGHQGQPYSSEDGVAPSTTMFVNEGDREEGLVNEFIRDTAEWLGITRLPRIIFHRDDDWGVDNHSFGRYDPDNHELHVNLAGRHIMDVLRTTAHELTHCRQHELDPLPDSAGDTGSPWENEAHATAGIIMRRWADQHPDMFGQGLLEGQDLTEGRATQAIMAAVMAAATTLAHAQEPPTQVSQPTVADALNTALRLYGISRIRSPQVQAELTQEVKNYLRAQQGDANAQNQSWVWRWQQQQGAATADMQRESDEPAVNLDDPIVNYDIPYSAIARPENLQQARRFGRISHYGPAASSLAIISVPVSKERPFLATMRNLHIPVKKSAVYEASGYIPTERERDDPRFKMALTVDVKPGQTGREANKLGLRTNSQGKPALLKKDLRNLVAESKALDQQNPPLGPETPPTMPQGTVRVDVSDMYDWYKLGQHISNMKGLGRHDFGKGPPSTIISFGDEDLEHKYIDALQKTGLTTTDIDPAAHDAKPGQKVDPTFNVAEDEKEDLVRSLREELEALEEELLGEVKMSPGELRRWAASDEAEGIRAGFEAEMIFRDTSGGDSDDYEPDYGQDQRARDIDEVLDFFRGGDEGISGGMANRLRESLYEEYIEWREEAIANEWDGQVEEQVRDWMETNVWGDDEMQDQYRKRAAEQLGIKAADDLFGISLEQREEIEQQARELFNDDVDQSIEDEDRNYEDAREYFRDMMADSDDFDQYDWFRDRYPYMSDVADAFGIDWPYYTGGREGNGSRSVEDIASSLQYAVDMPVVGSSNYHGTARRPGRWIIEPDGSLDPDEPDDELGLEIVSPPMPLPETLRKLQQVIDWANGDGDAYTNSSTGLHMGISIPHKGGAVDYVKLILFMGDQYVLDKFDRAANSYCASALGKLRDIQRDRLQSMNEAEKSRLSGSEKTAAAMDLMRKNLIELAQQLVQDGVGSGKYTSAHMKDDYIEFRSPGGDYLSLDSREDQALEDTMLRFARAMYIAGRPDVERREYSKKLYKLLSGFRSAETAKPGKDTRYKTSIETEGANDALELFAKYSSGRINREELKKQWAEQVLAKEAPTPSRGKAKEYEVIRDDTGEVIDTIEDWNPQSAMETAWIRHSGNGFSFSVHEKTEGTRAWEVVNTRTGEIMGRIDIDSMSDAREEAIERYGDPAENTWQMRSTTLPAKPASRRAQVAKKIRERPSIWRVTDTNTNQTILIAALDTQSAKFQAGNSGGEHWRSLRANDPDSMLVEPATAQEVRQYMVQQADNKKDSEQVQQRVQGTPGPWAAHGMFPYRVRWTERRNGQEVEDSMAVSGRNADAAMAAVRHALEVQGRDIISIDAGPNPSQGYQRGRSQQDQGEFTGRWQIRDALSGEVLHTISGVALPNQGDANRYARQWIERTGYGGAYEIVPEMGS